MAKIGRTSSRSLARLSSEASRSAKSENLPRPLLLFTLMKNWEPPELGRPVLAMDLGVRHALSFEVRSPPFLAPSGSVPGSLPSLAVNSSSMFPVGNSSKTAKPSIRPWAQPPFERRASRPEPSRTCYDSQSLQGAY